MSRPPGIPWFASLIDVDFGWVADGAAEAAASTPTELQRQRRPSYFAKPVIRAAPTPASQPEQPAPAMPNQASQAAPAPVKALPPLLLARLAKRGILPQVLFFAAPVLALLKSCLAALQICVRWLTCLSQPPPGAAAESLSMWPYARACFLLIFG